ncbi:GntR family transcriptional regulator [Gorillibacterium timonense]|uniref:GntR family transcriptional regulator n=1 Tax=Gorillibacterium timonense TaxID=1689269 RepID=UPI00071E2030|nr:GntR family transcriptional regulator [Gorillibacterium timonense]
MKDPQLKQPLAAGALVYASLKEQIVNLTLPPGTALSEKETALQYQVSRTPVRESFVRLAQEGLVVVLPQRGTRVSLIDSELVEEARFMREQLERAVIRLACDRFPEELLLQLDANLEEQRLSIQKHDSKQMFELDEEFHRLLFQGCRKQGTWNVIQQMNAHLNRSRILWLASDPDWLKLYEHHHTMLKAIRLHDADGAERLMQEHLRLSISDLPKLKEQHPDFFR